jgi:dephospho-CoA kinase
LKENLTVLLIGITGGIGMGKSAVSNYLGRKGEFVIDTDRLARHLVEPGQPALREIESAFGSGVLNSEGTLNRSVLAKLVFSSKEKRELLEGILHPRIREAWKAWAHTRAGEGAARAVVVIPLLFETAAEKELDFVICVASSTQTQSVRLRARGWSDDEIGARIASQHSIRDKMEKAHRVIWNDSTLEICELQVDRIFRSL